MTQALYAHMNNKKFFKNKKKEPVALGKQNGEAEGKNEQWAWREAWRS
jgi:hypothetical protein